MQGCLRIGASTAARGRPTTTAAPPGGNGLMKVMARVGKASSAKAGQAVSAAAAAALPATKRRLSTESSQKGFFCRDLPGLVVGWDAIARRGRQSSINDCNRSRPAGRSAAHFHRKAAHQEAFGWKRL